MNTLRFALTVGLALSLGCGGRERPNLILITIDTCRADRLSCYGYERETTPNLDRLASEGVLFENTRTCVPITLPSHVSILTGLYPTFHGVHENGF
jgi:arylsulfatase A-like enzyme